MDKTGYMHDFQDKSDINENFYIQVGNSINSFTFTNHKISTANKEQIWFFSHKMWMSIGFKTIFIVSLSVTFLETVQNMENSLGLFALQGLRNWSKLITYFSHLRSLGILQETCFALFSWLSQKLTLIITIFQ